LRDGTQQSKLIVSAKTVDSVYDFTLLEHKGEINMGCCPCDCLQKVIAAIDAIYHRIAYKYASVYTKSLALFQYYFSSREQNKRKSNKTIFHPDVNSIEAAVQAFQASNLSWKQWAEVTTKPEEKEKGGFKQVGGHQGAFEASDDKVKKLADKPELEFYEFVKGATDRGDPDASWIVSYIPKFYGTDVSADGKKQIVIENLLQGYKRPCIMDLKIGTETVGVDAKIEKYFRMMKRDVKNGSCLTGVRVIAMSTFHPATRSETIAKKKQAEALSAEATLENILSYFAGDGEGVRIAVVNKFLAQLEKLLAEFEMQKFYNLIGSSLLFVFDGEPGDAPKADVRMIDFAHVHRGCGGVDAGYAKGLRSLVAALKTIQAAKHLHDKK